MEHRFLVVIDAGHGGSDNGATSLDGLRLEKDDNLRLALKVKEELEARCVNVLMTRESDVFVSLSQRVAIANECGAGLFVSLHRNSYPVHTQNTRGISNYIYTTAPANTSGIAAQTVVDRVADVGVMHNWGVLRGDYYVLRNTEMPAMLLEMGFIIDPIDNLLFDILFCEYAAAIADGIVDSILKLK